MTDDRDLRAKRDQMYDARDHLEMIERRMSRCYPADLAEHTRAYIESCDHVDRLQDELDEMKEKA